MAVALAEPPVGGLPPGTLFGRYACLRRLARGGMAELYLARHLDRPKLEKIWVIKRVLPHFAEDAEFVQMFQNEARLASTLEHPHIAAVVDYGVSGEEHYLVMEYVHGKDARALLRAASTSGGLALPCALAIVVRVARALHYAHERRDDDGNPLEIVHRDVSPSNVLVGYDGTVRLADFGIAKAVARTNVTRTGTVKGKAGYMSPEQCRGEPVDRRSDVFGLGVLLYELTTLRRAFFAPSDLAIMSKVVGGDVRPPRDVDANYPSDLEAIAMRALRSVPQQRFASAQAFAEAVEAFAVSNGMSLEANELARTVVALFGSPPYPLDEFADQVRTDVRAPARGAPSRSVTEVSVPVDGAAARRARPAWLLPLVGAVALGLGGFALGSSLSESQAVPPAPPPAAPAASPSEAAAAAPTAFPPASPEPEAPAPEDVEPEEVIELEPDPAPPRRKKPRKGKARAKQKTFGPPKWSK